MSTMQKIVKAFAICLAIGIILSIVSVIASIICGIAGINFLNNWLDDIEVSKTINVENTFNIEDVKSLKLSSNLENVEIYTGDEFKVIGENVLENYSCKLEDNTIVIDSGANGTKIKIDKEAKIKIYVPDDFVFEDVNLGLSLGETVINSLNTDSFELKCGVGEVDIKEISVNKEAKISCGTGECRIENSKISNLEFNAGIGQTSVNSELFGKCSFETGMGELNISLKNFNEEDGKITVQRGVGEIEVNGAECSTNQTFGNGNDTVIDVKGGIGEITIEY